jgi:light-harvesting complex II chlorophyll a/b binding protein 2
VTSARVVLAGHAELKMAASALHQTTSFLGQALVSRPAGGADAGGRITMRRTVKSAPQSIWYVLL